MDEHARHLNGWTADEKEEMLAYLYTIEDHQEHIAFELDRIATALETLAGDE